MVTTNKNIIKVLELIDFLMALLNDPNPALMKEK